MKIKTFLVVNLLAFFFMFSSNAQNITYSEYFLNTDPGLGNGTNIPLVAGANVETSFSLDISSLENGFYNIYVRVKDENNKWSLTNVNTFYKEQFFATTTEIVKAEYFFNTDPGFGNAIDIPLTSGANTEFSFNLDISSLQNGFHNLYVRVKDENGKWSLTNVKTFYKENIFATTPEIVKAEYFFNTDPGFGNAINIPITSGANTEFSFNLDISSLQNGFHNLYVRVKDENGKWSLTNVKTFYKENIVATTPEIVKAEYFFNTDPGFGNAIDIPLTSGANTEFSFNLDISSLENGFHNLYVRVKDENDKWSLTNVNTFYKETVYPTVPEIVKAEYFFNTDPGFGNGIDIPLTPNSNISGLNFTAEAGGLAPGLNRIYVRVKDENNKWSLTYVNEFDVTCSSLIVDFTTPESCENQTVLLEDNCQNVYSLATYFWNFGDGTPIVEADKGNIEHIFENSGDFDIVLQVYNNSACSETFTKTITINPSPEIPAIPTGVSELCIGTSSSNFSTTLVTDATGYTWEISPVEAGTISENGINATVNWNVNFSGVAQIRVKSYNSDCEGDFSDWKTITIYPATISGNITPDNNTICNNSNTGLLSLEGNNGNIIRWEKQFNSAGWTSINNTSSTYSEIITQQGIWKYRAVVQNSVCNEEVSGEAVINVNSLPSQFDVSGGGEYCEGSDGVSINLSNSETGATYELYNNLSYTGNSIAGTGSPVSFENIQTAGNYTIEAENNTTNCTETMNNSADVLINYLPATAETITGEANICSGAYTFEYIVPLIDNATSYVWTLPEGASGTSTTNSIFVTYDENSVSGNITVKGVNSCGEGEISNLAISINPTPETPTIFSSDNVLYSDAISGNQWYNQFGIIEGATNQSFIATETGTYYSITTILGCSSEASNIIFIEITGIEQLTNNSFAIYPNPVLDNFTIESLKSSGKYSFELINSVGNIIQKGNFAGKTTLSTIGYPSGIYFVKLKTEDGLLIIKIIKI